MINPNPDQDSGHILVVDDNRINRMMLHKMLTDQGHRVTQAEDGKQALAYLQNPSNGGVDVILLDILMPELDGYQLLEKIKNDPKLHYLPVIMVSALDELHSVVRCIEIGATDYLTKPVQRTLLRARLNASLAEKRLRDLELEYLEQVGHVIGAAEAVEGNSYAPESLASVATREDALGNLARVFQRMAREVHLREQRLKQQLEQLRLDMEEMKRELEEPLSIYLPMDRRAALGRGETLPEQSVGSVLFADISGFTPLTAAFVAELGKQRGAEEMTRQIKQVFTALIAEVHNYRGSVISFSGDAITCWFDGEASALQAVACALKMQTAMNAFTAVLTPAGSVISLGLKVAVAAGPVRRFLVGQPEIQQIEVLAGQTLDTLAHVEKMAHAGEVVVAAAMVNEQMHVAEWREDTALVTALTEPLAPTPWPTLPALSDEQVRPWLPDPIYRRIREGTSQFMAELRPTHALFLQFFGLDYDGDPQAGTKLDQFLRWVQDVVGRQGGHVLQITTGDKGSYLYASFGALTAHEDDAVRATRAALELQTPPDMPFISHIQIGVASGETYTGAYGSLTRRIYGVLGDKVNMAARLMVAATTGILCDEAVYEAAQTRLNFEVLPPILVKGKTEPMAVFRPTGVKPYTNHHRLIEGLQPAAQMTLKVASVIGQKFSLAMLTAVYPTPVEKPQLMKNLAELVQHALIEEAQAGQFLFVDKGLWQLVYNLMLFAQRRQLHRAAAVWYEETLGEEGAPDYLFLAHHWQQAEDIARAIACLEKAAAAAQQAGDLQQATQLYDQALALEAQSK